MGKRIGTNNVRFNVEFCKRMEDSGGNRGGGGGEQNISTLRFLIRSNVLDCEN